MIKGAILVKLNQTFITPFDREDIHELASAMDDVLDFIDAAGERLVMYKISSAPLAAVELAEGRVLTVYYYNQLGKYYIGSTFWKPAPPADAPRR